MTERSSGPLDRKYGLEVYWAPIAGDDGVRGAFHLDVFFDLDGFHDDDLRVRLLDGLSLLSEIYRSNKCYC